MKTETILPKNFQKQKDLNELKPFFGLEVAPQSFLYF